MLLSRTAFTRQVSAANMATSRSSSYSHNKWNIRELQPDFFITSNSCQKQITMICIKIKVSTVQMQRTKLEKNHANFCIEEQFKITNPVSIGREMPYSPMMSFFTTAVPWRVGWQDGWIRLCKQKKTHTIVIIAALDQLCIMIPI